MAYNVTWDNIAVEGARRLMDPNASNENLDNVTNGNLTYNENHVDEADRSGWTGWTTKSAGEGPEYGGAVRTVILSGSEAKLKNLHVDGAVDTNILIAASAYLDNLEADNAILDDVSVENLEVYYLSASVAEIVELTASDLKVTDSAEIQDLYVSGSSTFAGLSTFETTSLFKKDVYVEGDLYVQGTSSYINTQDLYVKDKEITLASGSTSHEAADGAGITIQGADVEFLYDATSDSMTLNKDLNLGTGSIIADSGSIGDLTTNNIYSNVITASVVSASSFIGDGSQLTGLTVNIASSSTYRYPVTIESNGSVRLTYPFNTPDVFVQIYQWADSNFEPDADEGIAFDDENGSIQFTEASIKIFASESVLPDTDVPTTYALEIENHSPDDLKGYVVVADAGMMITGSIDILECTTDIAYFSIPVSVIPEGGLDVDFSHKLGTNNVITSFYRYDDLGDGYNTVRPRAFIPSSVYVLDSSSIRAHFGVPDSIENPEESDEVIEGYVVIAKAGHVVKESQVDDSWIISHSVHYGDDGDWLANTFGASTMSAEVVSVTDYVDTAKIGNLHQGPQYYQYYADLWGSYIEFTDQGIVSYVQPDGQTPSGSIPTASVLDSNGDLYLRGGLYTNQVFSTSDIREKENIQTITNALETVKQLRGVNFNWKKDGTAGVGTIAQEVQSIYPELTKTYKNLNGDERISVNYEGLVGVLIEAVKALTFRVEELEKNENR